MKTENLRKSLKFNTKAGSYLAETIGVCQNVAARFNQLKDSLVQKLADEFSSRISMPLLKQAVEDAEALAWSTPYPLLFLPVLAEEKVLSKRRWVEHQRQILERQGLALAETR